MDHSRSGRQGRPDGQPSKGIGESWDGAQGGDGGGGPEDFTPEITDRAGETPANGAGIAEPLDSGDSGEAEPTAEEIAASYLEQLQRLKAEFDNYRKRISREKEEWFVTARAEVVRQFLPVLDDLRRARQHWPQQEAAPEAKGLLLIMKRFEDILAQLGLEEQEAQSGTEFDPEHQEAVLTASSGELPEGRVLRTVEPGYRLHGRMLRPIKVSVSSGPPPE